MQTDMVTIETDRLRITALDANALHELLYNMHALEAKLEMHYMAEPIAGEFRGIVEGQLKITEADPDNYVWSSFWLIIRKSDSICVGSIDFKKPPEDGGVEIGYGLNSQFEHCGYMTETVSAFCKWAFTHESVDRVIAETENYNTASQNILKRCAFIMTEKGETMWWQLLKGRA